MSSAQFTIPLITVIPGQLITAALWNNEWNNVGTNLNPSGVGGYEDTDAQMQIQTAPFPGSVTSHATSLAGEVERIRYQIAAITGNTYWYQAPATSIATAQSSLVPIGGVIDYPSATPPNSNYHLADGTAIDRVIYATLFSLIGTTFGAGDGVTSFNLPNYKDRMAIGAGNLYSLAATGGSTTHTLTASEIPTGLVTLNDTGHTHAITDPTHAHGITDPTHSHVERALNTSAGGSSPFLQNGTGSTSNTGTSTASASTGVTVNNASTGITGANSNTTGASLTEHGGGSSHSILNPYLAMYKLIRIL